MKRRKFEQLLGLQQPMLTVWGDIFDTPLDHIAFAVHYATPEKPCNNSGGFAGEVAKRFWPKLSRIQFTKGEPVVHKTQGKWFCALPVHTNETGGWDDTPDLITECLNKLPFSSTEAIACVLIGGGDAGDKWKASPKNILGMANSYKEVVLYVKDEPLLLALAQTGICLPIRPAKIRRLGTEDYYLNALQVASRGGCI